MTEPMVKICGLVRRADALHAAEAGADYLGVVLVAGSPRARTPEEARQLLFGIQRPVVIVVADLPVPRLVAAAETVGASVVQLHGNEPPEVVQEIRESGPWSVWKALRVREAGDVVRGLARFGAVADGLLLDGWHPERLGGTGEPFPWGAVSGVRELAPPELRLIAAGGLRPQNVREAIARLRPHIVDVSSGVESRTGVKDPALVEAFIRSVRWETGGGIE